MQTREGAGQGTSTVTARRPLEHVAAQGEMLKGWVYRRRIICTVGLMSPSYRGATAPTDAARQAAAGIALAKGVVIAQTKTLLWGFPLFFLQECHAQVNACASREWVARASTQGGLRRGRSEDK